MRNKITSVVLAGILAGGVSVGAATSASAATHWSGNYRTLAACNDARRSHADYGQATTSCYKSYDQRGRLSYHFYWYS